MKKMIIAAIVAAGFALPMIAFAAEADMGAPSVSSSDEAGFSNPGDGDAITLADASDTLSSNPADSSDASVGQQD